MRPFTLTASLAALDDRLRLAPRYRRRFNAIANRFLSRLASLLRVLSRSVSRPLVLKTYEPTRVD
jgi:hypothetical protein